MVRNKHAGANSLLRLRRPLFGVAAFLCPLPYLFFAAPSFAQQSPPPVNRNMYGEAGLLDMPGAHMAPDGRLSITLSGMETDQRISLGFQIFPWLEGAFRYTRISEIARGNTDYDRSFGIKARLFQEDKYFPDVSVGIRDIVGTGIYSGEYLAFSKHIGDFDTTLGFGWGRLALDETFQNPLGLIFNSFKKRAAYSGTGGNFNAGSYFHGPDMGVFGGFVWRSPIDGLNFVAEYSSDKYSREAGAGAIHMRSPANFGLTYQLSESMKVTAGWFYGSQLGGSISFDIDPTTPVFSDTFDPSPPAPTIRTYPQRSAAVANYVKQATRSETLTGIQASTDAFTLEPEKVRVTRENELVSLVSGGHNIEIDGKTLLVDLHAEGHAAAICQKIAQFAKVAQIETIVITDLDKHHSIAICSSNDLEAKPAIIAASMQYPEHGKDNIHVADTGSDEVPPITALPNKTASTDQLSDMDTLSSERKIRTAAAQQSIDIWTIKFSRSEIFVYYNNRQYGTEAAAIGRLVRILMMDAPPNIEVFHFLPVIFGQPVQDIRILRAPLERMFEMRGTLEEINSALSIRPAPLNAPELVSTLDKTYPHFDWSLTPSIRQGLFDPKSPYRFQIYAAVAGDVELFRGFSLEGELNGSIYSTFDRNSVSNSVLPHVRTDTSKYLTIGRDGISYLDAVYRTRIAPDIFVEARAGYIESLFAGVGGQILWRPEGSRWAFGADAYQVWQRNFDRLFGLQHYHILTGHVSAYYHSPWYGLNIAVHTGRYLAGDYGATIEVTREFSTGVEIGAFATFTNVPFNKFGEGSFDKGIIIHIPLEWNLPFNTQTAYDLALRPIQRDGGQRLVGDDSLFGETKRSGFDEIIDHAQQIGSP